MRGFTVLALVLLHALQQGAAAGKAANNSKRLLRNKKRLSSV